MGSPIFDASQSVGADSHQITQTAVKKDLATSFRNTSVISISFIMPRELNSKALSPVLEPESRLAWYMMHFVQKPFANLLSLTGFPLLYYQDAKLECFFWHSEIECIQVFSNEFLLNRKHPANNGGPNQNFSLNSQVHSYLSCETLVQASLVFVKFKRFDKILKLKSIEQATVRMA